MNSTLIIGSTVLDMVVNIDHLPTTTEDMNTTSFKTSIGGCAFNAASVFRYFDHPYAFCSPIGKGDFGTIVRSSLDKLQVPYIPVEGTQGCCLCLVEKDGERTFISNRGIEYSFEESYLKDINLSTIKQVYISGMEFEASGNKMVEFVEKYPFTLYFAPGPRILSLNKQLIDRLHQRGCIYHLNRQEILSFMEETDVKEAMIKLYNMTHQLVIVTCGKDGAIAYNGSFCQAPSIETTVVDTIGAGDSHIGMFMLCQELGYNIEESLYKANTMSSIIISHSGATLEDNSLVQSILK